MSFEREEFEDDALEAAELAGLDGINGQQKPISGVPWFDKLADIGISADDDGDWKEK